MAEINETALKSVLQEFKLNEKNHLIYCEGKRGRAVRDHEAYIAYVQRSDDEETTPAAFREAAVAFLTREAPPYASPGFAIHRTAVEMAQYICKKRGIVIDIRGRYTLENERQPVERVKCAVRREVADYNRKIPKDTNGRRVTGTWTVEHVLDSLLDDAATEGMEAVWLHRDTLRYDPSLDADALIAGLMRMMTVEVTDLNVGIMMHWLHQAKCLIWGRETRNELMINWKGPQNSGKSYVQERNLSAGAPKQGAGPLFPFYRATNFGEFSDPHFYTLGSSMFTLGISEPNGVEFEHATPKEVENWKDLMTRNEFDSRATYTQDRQCTQRTFSLMCTSNKNIFDVIKNPTGQRRLFQFDQTLPAGRMVEGADAFPYLDLWKSIDVAMEHLLVPANPLWDEAWAVWDTYKPTDTVTKFFEEGPYHFVAEADDTTVTPYMFDIGEMFTAYKQYLTPLGFTGFTNVVTFGEAVSRRKLKHTFEGRRKKYLAGDNR